MPDTITETTEPAKVRGRHYMGTAFFIEAENGDLVDIEYECAACDDAHNARAWWPAFDFGTPDSTRCRKCGRWID